jgi:hypothetical protein
MFEEAVDALTGPRATLRSEREVTRRGRTTGRDNARVAVTVCPIGVVSGERVESRLEYNYLPRVEHSVGLIVVGEATDAEWASWRDTPFESVG